MPAITESRLPAVVTLLGRAGLLPFLITPVLMLIAPIHSGLWSAAIAQYALAIICFLVGSWWGLALIRRSTDAIITSNVLLLAAVLGSISLPVSLTLPLYALLLAATVIFESKHHMFSRRPPYYARLRKHLTMVAVPALLVSAVLTP